MFLTPALIGVGGKLVSNIINSLFANSAEKERNIRNQDATIIAAQVELAKEANKSVLGQWNRIIMFNAIVLTWCFIGVYMFTEGANTVHEIPWPKGDASFLGTLFSSSSWQIIEVKGAFLGWQWFLVTEMVIGFVCVPSRRR